ncbi:SGNH/GDSL hydrolase family protein [Shewanella psychropiezotolerans]|uniref:SGNH/GDSL hydrolase family protein n=1 Tax=Shewanella psychropiezotolerans TaxID=2593655 RepID=A0ABX5WYE8_9GAMM|nr:SGNH/GDSL hydrolase family protein [Shewanella psychropiezotolerans]QDO84130.1 SGNH/GDSL hydrolase family protein [Shewanella psychropiezotolerans]
MMNKRQSNSVLKNTLQFAKLTAGLIFMVSVVGCSGNPYVSNAERNEIITLGDSIYDLSGEIQMFLEQDAGETFRDYTQSGAELAGGALATSVITQYADAKADHSTIETIVMNGGGNDILIPAMIFDPYRCKTKWYRPNLTNSCISLVDDVYVDAVTLLNQMETESVSNVLYLGYYHTTGNLTSLIKAVDYGNTRLSEACSNTTANCSFIDPRSVIVPSDVISDNIHPTTSGSQKMAALIWPLLEPLL